MSATGDGAATLHPIGTLETPFETLDQCPRNGRQLTPAPLCHAIVRSDLVPGLTALAGFSHLILLYWLGRGAPIPLVFVPPFDPQARGVFATRSPARPNPIGLAVVAFEGFAAPDRLRVRYLDCLNGTELLDIKPYLRTTDCEPAASLGWLEPHATAC